jgi:hypothetical protein
MQQPVEHTRFRGSLPERRELLRPVREFMPLATGQVRRLAANGNPEEESSECSAFEQLNSEQPRGPNPSSHREYMVRYFLIVLPELSGELRTLRPRRQYQRLARTLPRSMGNTLATIRVVSAKRMGIHTIHRQVASCS